MDKTKEIFLKKLGERISQLREDKGLNQTQLAYRCGKDKQSINRLEKGNINPSAYYLYQLSIVLDVPVSELLNFPYRKK